MNINKTLCLSLVFGGLLAAQMSAGEVPVKPCELSQWLTSIQESKKLADLEAVLGSIRSAESRGSYVADKEYEEHFRSILESRMPIIVKNENKALCTRMSLLDSLDTDTIRELSEYFKVRTEVMQKCCPVTRSTYERLGFSYKVFIKLVKNMCEQNIVDFINAREWLLCDLYGKAYDEELVGEPYETIKNRICDLAKEPGADRFVKIGLLDHAGLYRACNRLEELQELNFKEFFRFTNRNLDRFVRGGIMMEHELQHQRRMRPVLRPTTNHTPNGGVQWRDYLLTRRCAIEFNKNS